MKLISRLLIPVIFLIGSANAQTLDYRRAIPLDAEALAEQGVVEAYGRLLEALKGYVTSPLILTEKLDTDQRIYTVVAGDHIQRVHPSPLGGNEYESWGVATATLFGAVNRQLSNGPVKLYALNSGNDLMGIFLTERQATDAQKALKRRSDWPYLPMMQAPWFGQYH